MIWHKSEIESGDVRSLSEKYSLDLLDAAILVRRGVIDREDIKFFLENDLQHLHNPFLFEDMEDAVERVLLARTEGEKIFVFGDRDADGITSTALLVNCLRDELGMDVDWAVPVGDEPYGLSEAVVDRCREQDITLIITVDCGTTNSREINYALEFGIDTVVIDHHNPQLELPPATAIINPKLPDCAYPFDGLCGCGLASQFCWALRFGLTSFFKEQLCLLHLRPGNDTYVLDCIKLENLIEIDRISENLVPGMVDIGSTRLESFLIGTQILVYNEKEQERMLRAVFGERVEIGLIDLAPEVWKLFPSLANKSLLAMRDGSRMSVYSETPPEEVDVFAALFKAFFLKRETALREKHEASLDLVALATVADMMPLRDENRILIRKGLDVLNAGTRPGLQRLLVQLGLMGKKVNAKDIGWSIAPVINASGRMGQPDKAVELLMSDDHTTVRTITEELIALNRERRQIGETTWDRVLGPAQESFNQLHGRFVLVQDDAIHRGVTGIIAGRLARRFNAPAAVVAICDDRAVGSVRSARGFSATQFLRGFEDIFVDWGGHDAAAGFHLTVPRLAEFRRRLNEAAPTIVLDSELEERIDIDAELPLQFLSTNLEKTVQRFEPYGIENPELSFLVHGLVLEQVEFMGKQEQKHVRLLLVGGGVKWPAVYWNAAEKVGLDFTRGDSVSVVFRYGWNYYQGRESVQLTVLDIRRETGGTA
ncbi:MAG: single-stranded-DNA-specific exonuclease RecJ [Spirochaetia bacterium]